MAPDPWQDLIGAAEVVKAARTVNVDDIKPAAYPHNASEARQKYPCKSASGYRSSLRSRSGSAYAHAGSNPLPATTRMPLAANGFAALMFIPRRSESTRPALRNWVRWWLTAYSLRPSTAARTPLISSPAAEVNRYDTILNRTGSIRAFQAVAVGSSGTLSPRCSMW